MLVLLPAIGHAGSVILPEKVAVHEGHVTKPDLGRISPVEFHEIAADQINDMAGRTPSDGLKSLETTAAAQPGVTPQSTAGQVAAWALSEIVRSGGEGLKDQPVLRMRLAHRLGESNVSVAQAAGKHLPQSQPPDLNTVADRLDEFFAQCVRDPLAVHPEDRLLIRAEGSDSDALLLPNLLTNRKNQKKR